MLGAFVCRSIPPRRPAARYPGDKQMNTRTTIILFATIFLIGIFLIVILPFLLVKRSSPSTPEATVSKKDELTDQGIFRSDDEGITWEQKPWIEGKEGSIAPLRVNRLIQDPKDSDTLYLLTDGEGIWISRSRGDLWAKVVDRSGILNPNANVLSLAVNPANNREWFAAVFQGNRGRLLRTSDGGESFREVYFTPLERYGIFDVAYDKSRDAVLMVTGQGGLLETRDQGATWRVVRWFADGLIRILVDPTNPSVIYVVSSRGSIFRTEDRGASFADVTNDLRNYSGSTVHQHWSMDSNGAIYLGSNYGIIRSRDHSRTYEAPPIIVPPDALPILALAVDPSNVSRIMASALNQLYVSQDDGDTWAIQPPPSTKRITQLLFGPKNSNIMYAVVQP